MNRNLPPPYSEGMQVEPDATLPEIDEAIAHVAAMLNEMAPHNRTLLLGSIDDLLDARLEITNEGKEGTDSGWNDR